MDLWQLNIFVQVVDRGSFSKAAQAVHLSQPTVSSHVKDLEEHFGCRLIDRLGRKAVPTKGGEILYQFARKLLSVRDETESAMAAFLGRPSGRLVIGGSTIPGSYILPGMIGRFVRRFPEVCISLCIGDTGAIVQKTLDGEVEMGLVGALARDKKLIQKRLVDDQMRLVVPGGHPFAEMESVPVSALEKEPFIMREQGSGTRRSLEDIFRKAGLRLEDLKIVAELGSTEAVRQAIRSGLGVSVLSTRAVAEEVASGMVHALAIEELDCTRSFYLIRNGQRTPSPLCAAFFDFLTDNAERIRMNNGDFGGS